MARILVIDDESNIRLMVRIALQAVGHQVETASDGLEGLMKFGSGTDWDLVLLDQRMPGIQGLEVLEEMRRIDPRARVMMITAFGTIDLAAAAIQAGAADFLRKPFTTDVLRGAVQSALDGVSPSPEREETRQIAPAYAPLNTASINGFRIASSNGMGVEGEAAESGGAVRHSFIVRGPDGDNRCEVLLPGYFVELVKAHADCDRIPDAEYFWLWLCEEALANHLWQNAEVPPNGHLQVDELTTGLRRWVDAVLTR